MFVNPFVNRETFVNPFANNEAANNAPPRPSTARGIGDSDRAPRLLYVIRKSLQSVPHKHPRAARLKIYKDDDDAPATSPSSHRRKCGRETNTSAPSCTTRASMRPSGVFSV